MRKEYPYHMHVQVMSRSKGHNALAAAAYRSGTKITEIVEENGNPDQDVKAVSYDYSRRHGVMSSFIEAPRHAPIWTQSRTNLWNKAEASEKRKDAQLAREVVVSLPNIDIYDHLNDENKEKSLKEFYERILKRYVRDNFTAAGMIADVALHAPSGKNDVRHFHAHIMLSMRELDETSETGFGEKNRSWNDAGKLELWRENFAHVVNDALKSHNINGFIDHRTHEARGLDIGVTKPLGMEDHKREVMGMATKAGNDNRKIRFENVENHKYLEKVFEYSPVAPRHEIEGAIGRVGCLNIDEVLKNLEEEGKLIPLHSKETGVKTQMYSFAPMQERNRQIKAKADRLYRRNDFALPLDLVKKTTHSRGDKMVRDALRYTAGAQGFKVVEADKNGHKKTYLSSCHEMYKAAGYDVIAMARNNKGKDQFKVAGFTKGILTYRDLLRRFGDRYTGAKSKTKKVIIVDEADQLSPGQDQNIMDTANKIGAKLIYLGSPKVKGKRLWQSLFGYYKLMSSFKKLRHKFLKTAKDNRDFIRDAFMMGRTYDALKMQKARYLHAHSGTGQTQGAVLDKWFKDMRKRDDKRFILCSRDVDAMQFNETIQKQRLKKKHLKEKHGKHFTARYKSKNGKDILRDMALYWGDMIQFKKNYQEHEIEEGMRARVLIHYSDNSLIETEGGRLMKVDLKRVNGFDLGYAGTNISNTDTGLEQGYIYHNQANAMDDAPLIYQKSDKPVHVFYDEEKVESLSDLSHQMLGRRHNMTQGFSAVSGGEPNNDNNIATEHEGEVYEAYRRD
ncbi:MAG: MobA/MobL family protein [Alphaproteobacteria bacterium]